jgi:hypothetical protein
VFAFGLILFNLDVDKTKGAVSSFSFPAGETTYQITTSKGVLTARFKYAPAIKNIRFGISNISTYLGNHFKNIMWIANRYGGGPAGRWDISDPWNPKGPDVVGIASGGSAFARGTQPTEHRGPFSSGGWPHPPSLGYGGGTFGELANGAARFVFASGEEGAHPPQVPEPRGITPVLQLEGGSGISIGQLFEDKWEDLFSGTYAVDATSTGKFFFFGGGGHGGYTGSDNTLSMKIFDVGNLTGSFDYGDTGLKPISSQSWSNLSELKIIEVPGKRNHFLIGRATNGIKENPKFYIGEIDADTGHILPNSKQIDLDLQTGDTSKNALVYPGSNIKFGSFGGNTYVFMNENFTALQQSGIAPGVLKVAVYKFNPSDLSLTRKGDITLKNFPAFNYANRSDAWDVARTENGTAYPMFTAISTSKTMTYIDSYENSNTIPVLFDFNFYDIKNIINATTPVSIAPAAGDVVIPGTLIQKPMKLGDIVIKGVEKNNSSYDSYHVFIKQEAGKNNLYLYRLANLWDGFGAGDPVFAYDEHEETPELLNRDPLLVQNYNRLSSDFRAITSFRIDKIDVTAFGTVTPPPAAPKQPISNNNPPAPTGSCTATLTFDKTSVVSGGSMTENWTVDGADIGQVFGDCGAGEIQISSGPKSYTFNNLTKNMTCRVYGKVGGTEACSASATITVTPPVSTQLKSSYIDTNFAQRNPGNTASDNISAPVDQNSSSLGATTLRKGSTGVPVENLQTFLNTSAGAGLAVDGKMGAKTVAAVQIWQADHQLVPDGVVGPRTKAEIEKINY